MLKVRFLWALPILAILSTLTLAQETSVTRDREGPIQIDADSGEFDNRVNAYKLFGNVRISHGSLTVFADEGFAYQTPGEDERVELFGSPTRWTLLMDNGTQATGQSDQIIYNLSQNVIVMLGNATVQDSRGTFTGARLTYDLETEKTEGEGGVKVVIDPPKTRNESP